MFNSVPSLFLDDSRNYQVTFRFNTTILFCFKTNAFGPTIISFGGESQNVKCMQLFHKQNYFGPITFSLFLYCCSGKAPGDRGLLNPEMEKMI